MPDSHHTENGKNSLQKNPEIRKSGNPKNPEIRKSGKNPKSEIRKIRKSEKKSEIGNPKNPEIRKSGNSKNPEFRKFEKSGNSEMRNPLPSLAGFVTSFIIVIGLQFILGRFLVVPAVLGGEMVFRISLN